MCTRDVIIRARWENQFHFFDFRLIFRVEICHDRRDRQSCKICASCVNFPENNVLSCIIFVKVHAKCDFTVEILHIELNLNENWLNLLILIHLRCFNLSILVIIYTLLVCKTFGLKIRSCKFFDKSQVWPPSLPAPAKDPCLTCPQARWTWAWGWEGSDLQPGDALMYLSSQAGTVSSTELMDDLVVETCCKIIYRAMAIIFWQNSISWRLFCYL